MPKILALGDSYTIGEGIDPREAWPRQLGRLLQSALGEEVRVQVIGQTGWTTEELTNVLAVAQDLGNPPLNPPYDLVTLMIGVNDQYQTFRGKSEYALYYEERYGGLLEQARRLSQRRTRRVVAIAIPDWSGTQFARELEVDPECCAEQIRSFNERSMCLALRHGAGWVQSFPNPTLGDPSSLAEDGLHPSQILHLKWAELLLPSVRGILQFG